MKRKTFIRHSSVILAGGLLSSYWSCTPRKPNHETPSEARTNWAGNYSYKAPHLHEPRDIQEVQRLVKTLPKQKALGSRHCFNNIADSPLHQVSLKNLKETNLNKENKTITVQAGTRYGDFCESLHQQGFALHNLASLPHITVAGACATATHGSGVNNGNLATAVQQIELITPSGEIVTLGKDHTDFPAIVVGLGAFGIITEVTLDIQEAFEVEQYVFQDMPLSSIEKSFTDLMSGGYSVSLFTNWMDKKISEVWVKRRSDQVYEDLGSDYFGAKAANKNLHPIAELSAEACTEQLGIPGPWYNRLPHFKMGFTPSAGAELQSEYFVPMDKAVDAIMSLERMREEINPHLMITEVRTIASDNFWMSPCYRRDSVAIHFTWKQHPKEVMALLPKIERVLSSFDVRPHWGKLFTISKQTFLERYPKSNEFIELAKTYDPESKFSNQYLEQYLF